MVEAGSSTLVEPSPGGSIPYRPESTRTVGDYAVVLAITLLALVAMLGIAVWLQRRGALPLRRGDSQSPRIQLLDRLRLGRMTHLSIVEHEGRRLAVIESPRGVAITALPDHPEQQ